MGRVGSGGSQIIYAQAPGTKHFKNMVKSDMQWYAYGLCVQTYNAQKMKEFL